MFLPGFRAASSARNQRLFFFFGPGPAGLGQTSGPAETTTHAKTARSQECGTHKASGRREGSGSDRPTEGEPLQREAFGPTEEPEVLQTHTHTRTHNSLQLKLLFGRACGFSRFHLLAPEDASFPPSLSSSYCLHQRIPPPLTGLPPPPLLTCEEAKQTHGRSRKRAGAPHHNTPAVCGPVPSRPQTDSPPRSPRHTHATPPHRHPLSSLAWPAHSGLRRCRR